MTSPLASGAYGHPGRQLESLLRPPKGVQYDLSAEVAHTVARSSNSSQSERRGKRSLPSKSRLSMQVRCHPKSSSGLLSESPLLLERFRQLAQSRYPLPCTARCRLQDCALTLPSRGQLPGYALQLPLMSNVRHHRTHSSTFTHHWTTWTRQSQTGCNGCSEYCL